MTDYNTWLLKKAGITTNELIKNKISDYEILIKAVFQINRESKCEIILDSLQIMIIWDHYNQDIYDYEANSGEIKALEKALIDIYIDIYKEQKK